MSLRSVSFEAFFAAVWGRAPFDWQRRLADAVASAGWPDVLDLPTGAGKTAAIDVAVWHLATAPTGSAARRILFVVDRRIVVDAAYERACALAERLRTASPESDLGEVAARLRDLCGVPGADPLQVARLRGGVPREPDWAGAPTQPVVAVSTVDQVGSRLLFRGYGVTPSMLPVQAGLVGYDALVLLDEAHLSEPFRQTLDGISRLRPAPRGGAAGVPWRHVTLSATPGDAGRSSFRLLDSDWTAGPLSQRLTASKRAVMSQAKSGEAAFVSEVVAATEGLSRLGGGTAFATLVVVNRIATARAVHAALASRYAGQADVELVIGRARPLERERRTAEWLPRMRAGRDDEGNPRDTGERPLVVVATQCVEAGADLDVDALVTESASLDALRQRFGRLDRLGRLPPSDGPRATIVHRSQKSSDPIYGDAIEHTWEWMLRLAGRTDVVDFGLSAMRQELAEVTHEQLRLMLAPTHDAPFLVSGHLDAWVETSPPALSPATALFLHGPQGTPDVTVIWRADISSSELAQRREGAHQFPSLEVVPPSALEAITISPWALKAWLARDNRVPGVLADLEGVDGAPEDATESPQDPAPRLALRREHDDRWAVVGARDVRPGDLLVLPADTGGCDAYGWNPESTTAVEDIGDVAHLAQRGQWVYRIPAAAGTTLSDALVTTGDDPGLLRQVLETMGALPPDAPQRVHVHWYQAAQPALGAMLVEAHQRTQAGASTEDDRGSFGAEPVTLEAHLRDVRDWTDRFAARLPLSSREREALSLAASWHDVGKADVRFQAMLRGEGRLSRFDERPAIAKGAVPWAPGVRERAGLPAGWRHEVSSTILAAEHFEEMPDDVRDLALWLIATHHGRGRPFFDEVPDESSAAIPVHIDGHRVPAPPLSSPDVIMTEHLERFERLVAWHGAHRLAWLEAILRLADHRASASGGSGAP